MYDVTPKNILVTERNVAHKLIQVKLKQNLLGKTSHFDYLKLFGLYLLDINFGSAIMLVIYFVNFR